jgi:flagellar capping protein FliD
MATTTNPITLASFNGIDFNTIIDAIIQADSQPLTDLQTQQQNIQSKDNASTNGYTNLTDPAADGGSISFTINGQTTTAVNVT